jgi:hypothetical protein
LLRKMTVLPWASPPVDSVKFVDFAQRMNFTHWGDYFKPAGN